MARTGSLNNAPLSDLVDLVHPDLLRDLQRWLTALETERHVSGHTLRAYKIDITNFLMHLAKHKAAHVSHAMLADADLRDFRSWLSHKAIDGTQSTSRARSLSAVRMLYKWLDRLGILHNAQIGLLNTPKIPHKVPRPLTTPSIDKILAALDAGDASTHKDNDEEAWCHVRDVALFTLLYGSGLRIEEALSIRIRDWPSQHTYTEDTAKSLPPSLIITGKGRKQRDVPVLPIALQAVTQYRAVCPYPELPDRPIFLGLRGKKLHQGVAQKRLRDVRRMLGLPVTATPHAFRHSFATHLLSGGLNLREVQELLGHASLTTTQRYTEVDDAQLLATFKAAHPRASSKQVLKGL